MFFENMWIIIILNNLAEKVEGKSHEKT